jgi:hypothetical protein
MKKFSSLCALLFTISLTSSIIHAEDFSLDDIEDISSEDIKSNPSFNDILAGGPGIIGVAKMKVDEQIATYPVLTLGLSTFCTLLALYTDKVSTVAFTLLITGYPMYKSASLLYQQATENPEAEVTNT